PLRPLILQPVAAPYGACRALLRAIEAMPREQVRPLVVFPYAGAAIAEYEAAGCDTVIRELAVLRRSSAGVAGLVRLVRDSRRTGRELAELARREGCDLIHSNSMTIVSGVHAAYVADIPHVWQLREAPRETGFRRFALRLLLRQADCVLAVSRAAARTVARGEARVIHDGYDLPQARGAREVEPLEPLEPVGAPGEFVVGMLGRISPTKSQHLAVEALGLLARGGHERVRLVIAGEVYPGYEGYRDEQVVACAQSLGVGDRVDLLGWVNEPEPLLQQLDALVIATGAGEGFGGAALEALAHGVPVVSSATGGIEELIIDGVTGLVCRPDDPEAIADALALLIDDDELRGRLAAAGREHAAKFTVEQCATKLYAAWRSVLSKRR
ncbi:MAG: glycosyltransferase family 4 protein, partial [Thermoleophilia bacterium]|nr:glycosyltransferase family 4 protein [Thermoleophilia bacterium]